MWLNCLVYRTADGRMLIVSSTDGYCSLITFDEGELGTVYMKPQAVAETSAVAANAVSQDQTAGKSLTTDVANGTSNTAATPSSCKQEGAPIANSSARVGEKVKQSENQKLPAVVSEVHTFKILFVKDSIWCELVHCRKRVLILFFCSERQYTK